MEIWIAIEREAGPVHADRAFVHRELTPESFSQLECGWHGGDVEDVREAHELIGERVWIGGRPVGHRVG